MSPLLQAGLNVTVIGMGVVFLLLTALVFIIRGMSALCIALGGPPASAPDPRALSATASAAPDAELVSVISAAIAAHRKRR